MIMSDHAYLNSEALSTNRSMYDSENFLVLRTKNRAQRAIRCNATLLFALILGLRQVGQSRRHLGSRTGLF